MLSAERSIATSQQTQQHLPPRTKFSQAEDQKLSQLVMVYPQMSWKQIAACMGNRTSRQCRERYNNYLAPEINHDPWTIEEDKILLMRFNEFGPQWAFMTQFFNGRSCVDIKNHHAKIASQQITHSSSNSANDYEILSPPPSSSPSDPTNLRAKYVLPSIGTPTSKQTTQHKNETDNNNNPNLPKKTLELFDNKGYFEDLETLPDMDSFYDLTDAFDHDFFSLI